MNGLNGHNGGSNDGGDETPDNIVHLPTPAERRRAEADRMAQARTAARTANGPMINLPPLTKWAVGLMILIHLLTNFAIDDVQRYWVFEHFGFIAAAYTDAMPLPVWSLIAGPFTYVLLHGSWMHLFMNGAMLMAFGTGCERWMGGRRLLLLFTLCSLAALAVQLAFAPDSTNPVIGASGGISGLFAAVLVMMQRQGYTGNGRFGIWPFILLWIGISVLFGMMGAPDGSTIAWPAHIGGFLAGFVFLKPVLRLP
jgi:membrane associated rhomboid family serine protease